MPGMSEIDRIIVVMMENRSFDHVFGYLSLPPWKGSSGTVDGLDADHMSDYANPDPSGNPCPPFRLAGDLGLQTDLPHARAEVTTQLALSAATGSYAMDGFVRAYYDAHPNLPRVTTPDPMAYLTPPLIPVFDALAREYCICDRWFAPIPTETFPNRFVSICGSSPVDANGQVLDQLKKLSFATFEVNTVLQWLDALKVHWKVYSTGLNLKVGGAVLPASFFMLSSWFWRHLADQKHVGLIDSLASDLAQTPTEPSVIFIDPTYSWLEDLGAVSSTLGAVDDCHPPLPFGPGDAFIRRVYEAASKNPAAWAKTLIIVTFDEHGGFFDHVPPMPWTMAPPPRATYASAFESTGPRVPALLISPWVDPRSSYSKPLDHTSILAALAAKFTPGTPYSPEIGARLAQAGSIWEALTAAGPRAPIALPTASPVPVPSATQKKLAVDSDAHAIFSRIIAAHSALQ